MNKIFDFGVSPAFVISQWGSNFTIANFLDSLVDIKKLGFKYYQPEIFNYTQFNYWVNEGAELIAKKGKELGLIDSQFVAHFLIDTFSSPEQLDSNNGYTEFESVAAIVDEYFASKIIVIPIPEFIIDIPAHYRTYKLDLIGKVKTYLAICEKYNLNLALEILPNSIVEGSSGFCQLWNKISSDRLLYMLDTGHTNVSKELVEILPLKLKDKIKSVHLCDNNKEINQSLKPGKGKINWKLFLTNLLYSGYNGSLDLEIICSKEQVATFYKEGMEYIKQILNEIKI